MQDNINNLYHYKFSYYILKSAQPITLIWNFKTLACTVHKIWHASDFVQIFSNGHNSRKGDNSDKKKTCVKYFSRRNPFMKFQNPSMHDSWTDGCTPGRMHNPKPICPVNFFEVGGIKIRVLLFFMLIPHIKFQDSISNRSWMYVMWHTHGRTDAWTHTPICRLNFYEVGGHKKNISMFGWWNIK